MIKRMIIMLLLVGLVLGGVYAFQELKKTLIAKALSEYAAAPQTVSAVKVDYQDWQSYLTAVGTLNAEQGVDVSSETPGIVETISFESGADVAAGATLVQLRLNDSDARLKQLQALADLAETTYQRDLRQLRERVVSQATVDSDLANLKSARAQVDAQRALIAEKTIRAPFAGRVGIRQVDVGQYVNPGTPLVTLQALDTMYVDFYLPQHLLEQLKVGETVSVKVDGFRKHDFPGKIVAFNARFDSGTRNLQIRASVENKQHLLLPGMYATVEVTTGASQKLLTLPLTALTFNPYGSTVFIVDDNGKDSAGKPKLSVHEAFVKTGSTRGDQVSVTSGLKQGQSIVTSGQIKLRNGTAIIIDNSVQPSSSADPKLPSQ